MMLLVLFIFLIPALLFCVFLIDMSMELLSLESCWFMSCNLVKLFNLLFHIHLIVYSEIFILQKSASNERAFKRYAIIVY